MFYPLAFQNARTYLQISLGTLAKELEVDKAFISRIENKKQKPSLSLIKKLEKRTGFSFWALVAGDFKEENQHRYRKVSLAHFKELTINLAKLTTKDQNYLKNKFTIDIQALERKLQRENAQLSARIKKGQEHSKELIQLESTVQTTQENLAFLLNNNAPAGFIAEQQEKLAKAQHTLTETKHKSEIISKRTIVLLQMEIEEIEERIKLRQKKIEMLENLK